MAPPSTNNRLGQAPNVMEDYAVEAKKDTLAVNRNMDGNCQEIGVSFILDQENGTSHKAIQSTEYLAMRDAIDRNVDDADLEDEEPALEESDDVSFKPEWSDDRVVCQCGFVSYDDSYDSDDSAYNDYHIYGCRMRHDASNLTKSYRHAITCPAKGLFPLEKLPPEIRRNVYRFAIPDDRTHPLHEHLSGLSDRHGYRKYDSNIRSPARARRIPTSLFRVNRSISAEALEFFHDEIPFRMDVTPFGIYSRGYQCLDLQPRLQKLDHWQPLKSCRSYHLNIRLDAINLVDSQDKWGGYVRLEIFLRMVSDEIASKDVIRDLTITAPCRCALKRARYLRHNSSNIIDLLKSFKRMRLHNEIKLTLHDDTARTGIDYVCDKVECLALRDALQRSTGRLDGNIGKGVKIFGI